MKSYIFFIAIIFIVLIGSFLLVPKVSTRIFPFRRAMLLNDFMRSTRQRQSIDARQFWMLREFYSPGYFTFKKEGLTKKEAAAMIKNLEVSIHDKAYLYPFLTFQSDKFKSIEALVKVTYIKNLIRFTESGKNCIINTSLEHMCYSDQHTLHIIFIKPLSEMMQTNGFYDYKTDEVKKIVEGKYWLGISRIKI